MKRIVLLAALALVFSHVCTTAAPAALVNAAVKTLASAQYEPYFSIGPAYEAVDDNTGENNTYYGHDGLITQYWQTDLGGMMRLGQVDVAARGFNLHNRLDNATIEVFDQNQRLVTAVHTGDWTVSGETRSFSLPSGTIGRTIRISRIARPGDGNGFDIAEVRALSNEMAFNRPVIDVINQHGATGSPQKLVDGSFAESNTVYGVANNTQTSWTVDLGGLVYVDAVQTFSRSIAAVTAARLNSFTIDILDGSKNLVLSSGVLNPGNIQPANQTDKQMVAWDVLGTQGRSVAGRYVRFSKPGDGTDNFDIAEARVYGNTASVMLPRWMTLVRENFADLALGGADGGVWTTTDPAGFELYNTAGGFSARAMSATYGGANNIPAGTAVPGGLEMLNAATDTTITLQVALPDILDPTIDGLLTFWAGQRIESGFGGFAHEIEIVNVTDNRTLVPVSPIANFANGVWLFNAYSLDFLASDAGDTLQVRFHEQAGNAARGLQLADLQLSVAVVPEPSAFVLAAGSLMALGALAGRRRARRQV